MFIPRFRVDGDLLAQNRDKDVKENDFVLQCVTLVEAVRRQILEIVLYEKKC